MKQTLLVKYYELVESGHWAFDDTKQLKSKIVQVDNLEDLNTMFANIKDVKILNCT